MFIFWATAQRLIADLLGLVMKLQMSLSLSQAWNISMQLITWFMVYLQLEQPKHNPERPLL